MMYTQIFLYLVEGCLWTSEVYSGHLCGEELIRDMEVFLRRIEDLAKHHQLVVSPRFQVVKFSLGTLRDCQVGTVGDHVYECV